MPLTKMLEGARRSFLGASKRLQHIIETIILQAAAENYYEKEFSLDDIDKGKATDVENLHYDYIEKAADICQTKSLEETFTSEDSKSFEHPVETSCEKKYQSTIWNPKRSKKIDWGTSINSSRSFEHPVEISYQKKCPSTVWIPKRSGKIDWGFPINKSVKSLPNHPPSNTFTTKVSKNTKRKIDWGAPINSSVFSRCHQH